MTKAPSSETPPFTDRDAEMDGGVLISLPDGLESNKLGNIDPRTLAKARWGGPGKSAPSAI